MFGYFSPPTSNGHGTPLPATTRDASEMLSSQLARDRLQRRKCLPKLLSNARFLARQGLAFRGDKDESDSNFIRMIHLRSEDNGMLVDWLKQTADKYTCGDMQNEMVKVMALRVLREIAASIQSAQFFTVMVDETTDVSNMEQVVVCLRYEKFVGLYDVASTRAETIYAAITDVLLRINLSVTKVRGQCYKTYKKVQELLLKAAAAKSYEEELHFVLSFYGSDFDSILLPTHLELFF